jgi:hypothetical protein
VNFQTVDSPLSEQMYDALMRGLRFLRDVQEPDGSWPDFMVAPGKEGREWTTAYIGALIGSVPDAHDEFWVSALANAARFIYRCRRSAGGWAFWPRSPVDADSTAWCTLFLTSLPSPTKDDFAAERSELSQHRCADGGFATYRRDNISLYPHDSGYYASTPCVSAAVGLALHALGHPDDAALVSGTAQYLLANRRADGSWGSFWWERGIYSTCLAVRLLLRLGYSKHMLSAIPVWLQEMQNDDGSWAGECSSEPNAFLTALALDTVLNLGTCPGASLVMRGLSWLLQAQLTDGSWRAPPILRVPIPDEPWRVELRPRGPVLCSHRRSFATATILAVLGRPEFSPPRVQRRMPAARAVTDPDFDREVGAVIETFDRQVSRLPAHLRDLADLTPLWRRRGAGLSHYLPFWLDRALTGGRLHDVAFVTALANRYGQFFCLIQDGVIDEDGTPPTILLLVDALFLHFLRAHQSLFPADHPFWLRFDSYWIEYLAALAWEKRQRACVDGFATKDIRTLAHKFSPVKISVTAIAYRADRLDALPALEELIESLQIGCQLLDDLEDWESDLLHDSRTWPLSLARQKKGGRLTVPEAENLLWREGIALAMLEKAIEFLDIAEARAKALGIAPLSRYINELISDIHSAIDALKLPLSSTPYPPLRVLHHGDKNLLLNLASGSLYTIGHEVASVTKRVAITGEAPETQHELAILDELSKMGALSHVPALTAYNPPDPAILCVDLRFIVPGQLSRILERALKVLSRGWTGVRVVEIVFFSTTAWHAGGHVAAAIARAKEHAAGLGVLVKSRIVIDVESANDDYISDIEEGVLVQLSLRRPSQSDAIPKLFRQVETLRHAGIDRVGVNVALGDLRHSPSELAVMLHSQGVRPIGVQLLRPAPPVSQPALRRTIEHIAKAFSQLADTFAVRVESGDPIPLVDVARPFLQVYNRKLIAAATKYDKPFFAVTPDGGLDPLFQLAIDPKVRAGTIKSESGRSEPGHRATPWCLTEESVDGAYSQEFARLFCRAACWGAHSNGGYSGSVRDPTVCQIVSHQFTEAIWLVARLEAHIPLICERLREDELTTFSS